jgi:hypothetical protein
VKTLNITFTTIFTYWIFTPHCHSCLLNSRSVILNTLPISPAKHYSYCHALRLPVGYLFGADKDLRKMSGDTGRRMVHIILMLNDRSTLSLVMDWGGRNMTMSIMMPIYY